MNTVISLESVHEIGIAPVARIILNSDKMRKIQFIGMCRNTPGGKPSHPADLLGLLRLTASSYSSMVMGASSTGISGHNATDT